MNKTCKQAPTAVLAAVLSCFVLCSDVRADDAPGANDAKAAQSQPNVFDLPALHRGQLRAQAVVTTLFTKGEYAKAEAVLRQVVERLPFHAASHYNLACALARQGKNDEALAMLRRSVELGVRDPKHIEDDDDLKSLRGDQRFKAIVKLAGTPLKQKPEGWRYKVKPGAVADGQGVVTAQNVAWDARRGMFRVYFDIDTKALADKPIVKGFGKAGELLRKWQAEGSAAGNAGDLYDNHDSDHSNMSYGMFPQITRIEFGDEAKKRRLHHGLQLALLYNGVTIGNSSTALTSGPFWRSQPRYALTRPRGPAALYVQYMSNHIYFYPEHRDHDPGHNGGKSKGYGDVIPANTPYMIVSQGSSGSDRAFMHAVAATLAAFQPQVKQKLAKAGMIAPTVQMIFRMSNKMVARPQDYLTGKAHPTAFDSKQLDVAKMVTMAHDLKPDALPPIVQLKVVEEDQPIVGRDYFDYAAREKLFDTPCAIARVVKSTAYTRRMVVSAAASKDLNGEPLTYHWVVLRGDADRIVIRKLDDAGTKVELVVPYHERRPITPGSDMESNRVDIGVFVHNGTHYSAPAFISLSYLDNQKRVYDDRQRIRSVDYADPSVAGNYADPMLDATKRWRDEYHYDDAGTATGWTRIRGNRREHFTASGLLILKKDARGQPTRTAKVRYLPVRQKNGTVVLEQQVVPSGGE